jgi:hypothetical protein
VCLDVTGKFGAHQDFRTHGACVMFHCTDVLLKILPRVHGIITPLFSVVLAFVHPVDILMFSHVVMLLILIVEIDSIDSITPNFAALLVRNRTVPVGPEVVEKRS